MKKKRILYLDSYVATDRIATSSDAIGYGITSSRAIAENLAADYEIIHIPLRNQKTKISAMDWIHLSYQQVAEQIKSQPPDLIFIFHIFYQFPAEIKRMLCTLKLNIPIIGYTHGSHWDPTDTFRVENYPGLEILDLANLTCLDNILLASHQLKQTLCNQIKAFNQHLFDRINPRFKVVGLPINLELIDQSYTARKEEELTIVFNHALITSKNPCMFFNVIYKILSRYPNIKVIITRGSTATSFIGSQLNELESYYPKQIQIKDTMELCDYYSMLWQSDIQISTALHESLGIATLEAMYTKNCCILPNHGSYPEISSPIHDHLYEYDEKNLFNKMVYYIENKNSRTQLSEQLSNVAINYSPNKISFEIKKLIEKTFEQHDQ